MAPPQRIYRQAEAFIDALKHFAPNDVHLDELDSTELANGIDRDWAAPLLVAVWDRSFSNEEFLPYRPPVKAAMVALRRPTRSGYSRSVERLIRLVVACDVEISDEAARVLDELPLRGPDDSLMLAATGMDLQLGEDARQLVDEGFLEPLLAIARILNGAEPARELANFPHLSLIPNNSVNRRLWRGLYLRLAVLFSIARFAPDREGNFCVLPVNFYNQTAVELADNSSFTVAFTKDDLAALLEFSDRPSNSRGDENQLTAYPFTRAGNVFCTSVALVLDSIAPWVMFELMRADQWKTAVSDPFEARTNAKLSGLGMDVASVSEKGWWGLPAGTGSLARAIQAKLSANGAKCPGEIDGLAVFPDGAGMFLIECKSVNAISNLATTAQALSQTDVQSWQSKARRKAQWIEESCGRRVDLNLVVIEGLRFIREPDDTADVLVVDSKIFEAMIEELFTAE